MYKKSLLLELKIYAVVFLAILNPVARLIKYNHEHFNLSGVEYFITVAFSSSVLYLLSFVLKVVFTRKQIFSFSLLLLVGSVVLVYFIPIDLSVIEGKAQIEFEARAIATYFLFAFPFLLLLVKFVKAGVLYKTGRMLGQFAVLYTLAFSFYSVLSVESYTGFTGKSLDSGFQLSAKKNIFVISFDQMQGTLVTGMLQDNDSEIEKVFDNFVFYSDAASTYPNTNYSLASVALGRIVENASESADWAINSNESFLKKVKDTGYNVYVGGYYKNSKQFECLTCAGEDERFNYDSAFELLRNSFNLLFGKDIAVLVEWLPKGAAQSLITDTSPQAWKHDIDSFKGLIHKAQVKDEAPALFFMHFLSTHQPFTYNADCSLKRKDEIFLAQNPQGAKESFQCLMSSFDMFLTMLKENGLYDSSDVFLFSDHGFESNVNDFNKDKDFARYLSPYSSYIAENDIKPVGAYNPILFYKPSGSDSQFKVSNNPVSLLDVSETICVVAGCELGHNNRNLSEDDSNNTVREIWFYQGGLKERFEDSYDRLHHGLDTHWKKISFSGSIYPELAKSLGFDESRYLVNLNTQIKFDSSNKVQNYVSGGWSGQESTHRWTEGSKANLQLPLDQSALSSGKALRLRFQANGFAPKGKDHQPVTVLVNDTEVAQWQLRGVEWHEAIISAEVAAKQWPLQVDFLIAEPTAPCDVSSSKDCRKLGMAARELVLEAVESGQ